VKKTNAVVFFVLSLLLISLVGTAAAWNPDYTHTIYYSSTATPTVDGTYIMDDEWLASGTQYFGTGNASIFRDEWTTAPAVLACLLIETPDNTTDAGDKWIICYDGTEAGGATAPDNGTAPQEFDYKLEVTGHGPSATYEWFEGNGTDWALLSPQPDETLFNASQALTTTPKIIPEHYVLELAIDKTNNMTGSTIVGYNWAQFVSYYDANTTTTQQWPPADATPAGDPDVPDSWGYIGYQFAANPTPDLPDAISIIALIALSSVAATGAIALRKRKIAKLN
jgi:hypothetical protein